ncbi:hypothetical protein [Sphingobacterium thalpophilum]|uniref:hypothetical protein n=1 Tax=Sphingobacterium thalpophilum TaxID=259 RepID=UPI003D9848B8
MAELKIYRGENPLVTVSIERDRDAVRDSFLMGDDVIKVAFDHYEAIDFLPYDYILHHGRKYSIKGNDIPKRVEAGKRLFRYEANFKAPEYRLNDMPLRHLGKSKFSFFGTPQTILQLIVDCMAAIDNGWDFEAEFVADGKLIDFQNVTCRQGITMVAEVFNMEYAFEGNTIKMAKKVGNVLEGFTFGQGRGNGLYELTELSMPDIPFATRFYGFGGSKNVPANYRNGETNIVMTGEYIEMNVDLYGTIIHDEYFEDIYPTRESTLTSVVSPLVFRDDTIDFDLNDQIVEGAKIVFTSGDLAFYEGFEIASYDHATKTIQINELEEENGNKVPNSTFKAIAGDKYKLIGIIMPESYITEAENKVADAMREYAEKHSHPTVGFELALDELHVRRENLVGRIQVGTSLHVVSEKLKVDRNLRVTEMSYPIFNPSKITAKIGDTINYTLAEKLIRGQAQNNAQIGNVERTQEEQARLLAKRTKAQFVTLTGEQVFVYGNDINKTVDKEFVTLVAMEHNFIAKPEDRIWEYYNGAAWVQVVNSFNTLVLEVNHQSAMWNGEDSLTIRYRVGDLYDQITLVKLYSGSGELTVVVTSDYGDIFFNGNIDTWLRANVYFGGENITDTIPVTGFQWTRKSADPAADEIWNFHEGKDRKEVHIDETDVVKKAVFECEVTVNI